MSILEERQFFAGENSDYEDRKMEPGDYRFGLNIEVDSVDSSNMGVVTNSKGNRLVSVLLPSGTNEVIGQGGDDSNEHTYYFLYNSTSRHSIFRFNHLAVTIDLVMENPMFNFSVDHRVNSVNIVDNKLLYFNDGFNPPRKINVNKATEAGKLRKFNIYFGDKPQQGETYSVTASFNGVAITTWTYTAPVIANGSAYDLAHALASSVPPNVLANFSSCGASVEVEFANPGEYDLTATSTVADQVIVVAENFYPKPYPEDFIDRLKYPFTCEPTALYKEDASTEQNLVQDQVFQFAIQYIYDDNEKSAISPYSMIPAPAAYCGITTNNSNLNYIEVDFTNTRLNDRIKRSLIRSVNIIYREHNTGELKLADTLQPHQFGINKNIYRFYNNANYIVIPDNEANKLFDSVPITCGTSDVIASRIFDADIVEGYDPTCIDAKIDVSYNQARGGFDLSGVVSIVQATHNGPVRWRKTPVIAKGLSLPTAYWGLTKEVWRNPYSQFGLNQYDIVQTVSSVPRTNVATAGGFIVYLAGTDMYGVTKQRVIRSVSTGLVIDRQNEQNGLINWDDFNFVPPTPTISPASPSYLAMIAISNGSSAYTSSFLQDWKISGVQPGVYSLRVAATNIGPNELIDPLRKYQKTSTTIQTQQITDFFGNPVLTGVCGTGQTEAIIEVLASGVVNVRDPNTYLIIHSSVDGDVGETFVRDYSDGAWGMWAIGGNLYLLDGGGDPVSSSVVTTLDYPHLSKVKAKTRHYIYPWGGTPTPVITENIVTSDHNGYVSSWMISYDPSGFYGPSTSSPTLLIEVLTLSLISNTSVGLRVYWDQDPIDTVTVHRDIDHDGYYFHDTASLRIDSRSFVDGEVRDSYGNLAQGVNIVVTNHGTSTTDSQGKFSVSYYSTNYPSNELDRLLISSTGLCRISPLMSMAALSFIVGPLYYTEINHYYVGSYSVAYFTQGLSALKRGWDGSLGIVYYDRGNRSSAVNTNESLELHVPFYTEPVNGIQFVSHAPVVEWTIRSAPPDWATHYQWVRTKNYQMSFYLQFVANTVEYVNKPEVPDLVDNPVVGFATGRYAAINTDNLVTYKDQYASSLLAYTWEKGDRIRFIAKPGNIYYSSYFDFEILSSDGVYLFLYSDQYIGELPNGVVFEIYRPKQSTNQKIFYEIGECYEIGDLAGVKYHKGPSQDQNPSNPFVVPATGVFATGDAWYRERLIPYNSAGALVGEIHTIDSASISDFYSSEDDNIGRPNIYDPNLKQIRREKSVRFSDVYLEDTQINGLSSNGALNIETIEKGEGPVYKLIRVNDALLAIQGSQCNSLYINEIIYIDANANPSLTASTKVIGTIRPLSGEFGTINPESVVGYEGKAYFFDQLGGNVIRYAQDGLNPINYFKMRSYFGAKAREMASLAQDQTYAVGGFDPLNKRYLLTFKKNRINSIFTEETKVFNELTNRWTSSQSFISECYGMTGMSIISFKEGELWVHDSPVKNSFYGVQYTSKVGAVFNQESGKVRNFLALSEESDGVWSAPVIEVPPNANALSGMLSRLILTKFVKKEGVWYAAIMKDMNSPNFATPVEALINGRSMRGHVLLVTLENDQNTNVKLNAVNLKYIYSEPSKK